MGERRLVLAGRIGPARAGAPVCGLYEVAIRVGLGEHRWLDPQARKVGIRLLSTGWLMSSRDKAFRVLARDLGERPWERRGR